MSSLKEVIYYENTNSVEATWVDESGNVIRCHSYADCQMDMFRDDITIYGGNIADYTSLIATVEANIVPTPTPTAEEIAAAEALAKKVAFMEAWENLTITFEGNTYACKKSSMTSMQVVISMTAPGTVIRWYEDWGNFDTTPEILGQVLQLAIAEKEKLEQGALNG